MVEALYIPFDDIYKTSVKIAKEWGDESQISVKVIGQCVNIAIDNAAKMKGKEIAPIRTNLITLLGTLKTLCNQKAEEMGRKTIPRVVLAEYIRVIKDKIKEGSELK